MVNYVAYIRVSTEEQGRSGLGLEAQREAIRRFLREDDRLVAPEFVEIGSGKSSDRPVLMQALAHAKLTRSTLVVAKLDRLSRQVTYISQLLKQTDAEFVACDSPHDNAFIIHVKAAMAEEERLKISERTKAALAAAKARGTKLGGFRGVKVDPALGREALRRGAESFKSDLGPVVAAIRAEGVTSLRSIAATLNARGYRTRRGGDWSAVQVSRVLGAA